MQSFFIATDQFSVQNVGMQEQKAKTRWLFLKKIGIKNLVWLTMFAGLMVVVLGVVLYTYRNLPVGEWRVSSSKMPIRGIGVVIDELTSEWKSAKGNSRMELRTAYYPLVSLRMQSCTGNGIFFIKFVDGRGEQKGDHVVLRYRDGQFVPVNDFTIKTEDLKAEVCMESGFGNEPEYRLHRLKEEENLWRVQIWQRPAEATTTYYLGYCTIIPNAD